MSPAPEPATQTQLPTRLGLSAGALERHLVGRTDTGQGKASADHKETAGKEPSEMLEG